MTTGGEGLKKHVAGAGAARRVRVSDVACDAAAAERKYRAWRSEFLTVSIEVVQTEKNSLASVRSDPSIESFTAVHFHASIYNSKGNRMRVSRPDARPRGSRGDGLPRANFSERLTTAPRQRFLGSIRPARLYARWFATGTLTRGPILTFDFECQANRPASLGTCGAVRHGAAPGYPLG